MNGTGGRWQWMTHHDGRPYLATPNRGRLIVMDFVRKGMGGAQPRFATWKGDERENMGGIMVLASELDLAAHPDACAIAAAGEMLESLREMVEKGEGCLNPDECSPTCCRYGRAKAIIARAEGRAS